jgi:hypothetical protein
MAQQGCLPRLFGSLSSRSVTGADMANERVYFVTNRNYLPDNEAVFGGQFNSDGIAALRFGWVEPDAAKPHGQSIYVYPDP